MPAKSSRSAAAPPSDIKLAHKVHQFYERLQIEIAHKIKGNLEIIEGLATAILSDGHVLLIGVPGLGKTLMIKSLAELLGLNFNRIQFTPDLMPSDITGSEILFQEKERSGRQFKFVKGPVFANIILADEINRTPPRTQSALLQAMEEKQVTVGGKHYTIDEPFFVLATQNPIEQEGTYPLPEAQLDRFMFSLKLTYPSLPEEIEIANLPPTRKQEVLKPIIRLKELTEYQALVHRLPVAPAMLEFIVNLVRSTRPENNSDGSQIEYGAGPRASQALLTAARAMALLQGDFAVDKSHIFKAAPLVLQHRLILNFQAVAEGYKIEDVLNDLLEKYQSGP